MISQWQKINSVEDLANGMVKIAFVIDGVIQMVSTFDPNLASLLLANPTAIEATDSMIPGQRID